MRQIHGRIFIKEPSKKNNIESIYFEFPSISSKFPKEGSQKIEINSRNTHCRLCMRMTKIIQHILSKCWVLNYKKTGFFRKILKYEALRIFPPTTRPSGYLNCWYDLMEKRNELMIIKCCEVVIFCETSYQTIPRKIGNFHRSFKENI